MDNRTLLITGASSDIGKCLLKRVAAKFGTIILQYRTPDPEWDALISQYRNVISIQADFSSLMETERFIQMLKERELVPTHFVHLPAPKAYNLQFHKDVWSNYDLGWNISVRSATLLLEYIIPQMTKKHFGKVVLMLTAYTDGIPPKYQSSYVTVKYALLGLMKAVAVEYAEKGITVNGISPEMMETKFLSEIPSLIIEQNAAKQPGGVNLSVEETVEALLPLIEDANEFTGQNIVVKHEVKE